MNQSFIPDLLFLKEVSFASDFLCFKIKAENIFGRCFGDREFIPAESWQISYQNQELDLFKRDYKNDGQNIIITYQSKNKEVEVSVYL